MQRLLIIDDQSHILDALELLFDMHGIQAARAQDPDTGLRLVREGGIGAVVQDMNFSKSTTSGEEGVALFHAIRAIDPEMPVILMTAWAALETAISLVKQGADDYLQKPWDDDLLVRKVRNLLEVRELTALAKPAGGPELCGLVFQSAVMKALVDLAIKVAPSDVSALVTGANGTGKELLAEIVHANSSRRDKPFIKVNVGALPDELFAAELFGAEAGAYTGAKGRRIGRFEQADGGTLMLDEMGTLSVASQAMLLRALQSGEYQRLGSNVSRQADVRIIAATNLDMPKAIAAGQFREDLYYRLAVIELQCPPLADRAEDIPLLARAFVQAFSKEQGKPAPALSESCVAALQKHPWSGNVRELQNRVRRALLTFEGDALDEGDLGLDQVSDDSTTAAETNEMPLEQAEREVIQAALKDANFNVSGAAKALGVSRQALYRRMRRLGVQLKRDLES